MIVLFILRSPARPPAAWLPQDPAVSPEEHSPPNSARDAHRAAARKGCALAAHPRTKTGLELPRYLRAAEVADILHVSPKTVSRWAKEGKLPFLKTLGGHRRYPAAEIRQLADQLRVQPTPNLAGPSEWIGGAPHPS
jgi:excisionase family DNA binding protein